MQHIFDYIIANAEKTIKEEPFGEVDFLALSQLSYLKLGKLVPGMKKLQKGIRIKELGTHPGSFSLIQNNWFGEENWKLLKLLSESKRYGDIWANWYVDYSNRRRNIQFQAVTFYWEADSICVCFRGTDESVTGWREDFNLAYYPCIPSQEMARAYLYKVAKYYSGDIYLAGHSKGGNLAVYAATEMGENIQKRIRRIYNFDGPGGGIKEEKIKPIQDKVNKYVPQQSVVGILLETKENYRIIKSEGIGIVQHNPYHWWIQENSLVACEKCSLTNRVVMRGLNWWIRKKKNKKVWMETLFSILDYSGRDSFYYPNRKWWVSVYYMIAKVIENAQRNIDK